MTALSGAVFPHSPALVRRYPLRMVILGVLAGAAILPPFLFLAYASLHQLDASGGFGASTFSHFAAIFAERTFGPTLVNSLSYALGSALLALVIGAAQAWLAERTDAPLRQLLYIASIISLGVPYVLYIVAWLLLLGKAGPVNALLQQLFGSAVPHLNLNSLGGMIFVEGMLWSPLAFLLLAPVFRNSDAAFEEAATVCGAGLVATFRRITMGMPLVFPAIVLGLAFLEIFVHAGGAIYGTLLSLIIASVVAYMPYGLRYAQIGVIQIHPELEEAATLSGARQTRAFVRIVLPLLVPALVSCWLFVFLLAVRAVSLLLLLVGPESQVVAVALFDFWNNGQIGELAALGAVWTAIMTVFSVTFLLLAGRYQMPVI
jgi:ABC-type Fe3+ transport system permease subunit